MSAAAPLIEPFRQTLREFGWVEGRNIVIDFRFADGKFDRLPDLAAALVRLEPDLIFSVPTAATLAVANATKTIPIVMFGVSDPVGLGLVASLAHPGGNVTGLSGGVGPEIVGKQLQLLKETLPMVSRVAVLSNPANPGHASFIGNAKVSAQSLGLQPQLLEARGPDEFDGAFAAMSKGRAGAVLVLGDPMFSDHYPRLADLAARHRYAHGPRPPRSVEGIRQREKRLGHDTLAGEDQSTVERHQQSGQQPGPSPERHPATARRESRQTPSQPGSCPGCPCPLN